MIEDGWKHEIDVEAPEVRLWSFVVLEGTRSCYVLVDFSAAENEVDSTVGGSDVSGGCGLVAVDVVQVASCEKALDACVRFERVVGVQHEENFVSQILLVEDKSSEIFDEVFSRV